MRVQGLLLLFLFLFVRVFYAQNDSTYLAGIAEKFRAQLKVNLDSAEFYAKKLNRESKRLKDESAEALSNNFTGICKIYNGDYDSALAYLNQSLRLRLKANKNTRAICDLYSNIGVCYDYKGDFPKAIDSYLKSLSIAERTSDTSAQAKLNNNIGAVYYQQHEYKKALDYFLNALKMREALNEVSGIATCCLNISNCYDNLKMHAEEDVFLEKCVKFAKLAGDSSIMAETYTLLADRYLDKKEFDKAIDYYNLSIACFASMDELRGQSDVYYQLGAIYLRMKNYVKANEAMRKSYDFAEQIDYLSGKTLSSSGLAVSYAYLFKPDSTEKYVSLYKIIYDTLYLRNSAQQIAEMQTKYDTDKKEQENKLLVAQNEAAMESAARQRIVIVFVVIALVLIVITAIVIYRGYINKKAANEQLSQLNRDILLSKEKIETQKDLIEEKQKEILDSIAYAKRLQSAIMPSEQLINKCFPDNFVLYLPKDIVAGDFYWLEQSDDVVYFAAADCTGHGVPGAMVSVVCSNALNRAVNEFDLKIPGQILDKVRDLVIETFKKSNEEVKDGMDISLMCLNTKTGQILWAGANNPLWYLSGQRLEEIKADKQPIGLYSAQTPFTTHNLELKKGDIIYLFTDGYADQFGGPKGKKFKYKQLAELIERNSMMKMEEQKQALSNEFFHWKGQVEQVDDVCIIGIRI